MILLWPRLCWCSAEGHTKPLIIINTIPSLVSMILVWPAYARAVLKATQNHSLQSTLFLVWYLWYYCSLAYAGAVLKATQNHSLQSTLYLVWYLWYYCGPAYARAVLKATQNHSLQSTLFLIWYLWYYCSPVYAGADYRRPHKTTHYNQHYS